MSKFAEPMTRLIEELKKLPALAARAAQRLAFHILRFPDDDDAEALAAAVRDVKANLRLCSICNNITDVDPCVYCSSATRNQRTGVRGGRTDQHRRHREDQALSTASIMCCMDRFRRCTE